VPAIIEAWYPGEEGGNAVAAVIAGDFSPAGRLPVTFYKSVDQLPAFNDYSMARRTYRYFDGEPLYPFGHGLSYTKFSYARPRISASNVAAGEDATVSVDVTNSGGREGDEVVQLYVSRPAVAGAPVRALKAFQRIALKPGEMRTIRFTLDPRALSTVDAQGERKVEAGKVDLWIGGGQPVARPGLPKPPGVAASFTVTGTAKLPG
jgi:beta-glucosidase